MLLNINHPPHNPGEIGWVMEGHEGVKCAESVPLQMYVMR